MEPLAFILCMVPVTSLITFIVMAGIYGGLGIPFDPYYMWEVILAGITGSLMGATICVPRYRVATLLSALITGSVLVAMAICDMYQIC